MATDYTTHYNLDKYVGTDKPNLRDQYNSAMDKIDAALLSANTNATEAKAATTGFQSSLTELQGTVSPYTSSSTIKSAIDAEALARQNADTDIDNKLGGNYSAQNTVAGAISTETNNRQNADTALSNRITALENPEKYLVIIGDSWSNHSYPTSDKLWWNIVARAYGLTPYNAAVGGTGFCVGNPTFYQQLTNAASALTGKVVERVIIFGGMNDVGNKIIKSTYQSAVSDCAQHARELFPNAHITIVGIAPHFMYNQYFDNTIPDYDAVGHYSSLLQYSGLGTGKCDEFIDARFFGLFTNGFFASGQNHPSASGHADIANRMLGGSANNFEIHSHDSNANPILVLPDNTEIVGSLGIKPCGTNEVSITMYFSIPSANQGQTGSAYLYTKGAPPIPQWTQLVSQEYGTAWGLNAQSVTLFDNTEATSKFTTKYKADFTANNHLGDSGHLWVAYTVAT